MIQLFAMVATFAVMSCLSLSFTLIPKPVFLELELFCQISSYCSQSNHNQPWPHIFESYNTECMMLHSYLQVLSHSTPEYWMEIANKRGTLSFPSFTTTTPQRLSGRTGYDEWLDSDTYSWFEKTEQTDDNYWLWTEIGQWLLIWIEFWLTSEIG